MTAPTRLFHSLVFADAPAAIAFLRDGLGFTEAGCYTDEADPTVVLHAQMNWPGGGGIMLGSAGEGSPTGVAKAYLVVQDDAEVARLHRRAIDRGATSIQEPTDMDYGGRGSTLADPEGNQWSIGSYTGH